MKPLALWVKYMTRALQVPEFSNVTVCADFIDALKYLLTRNRMRKEQKKIEKYFHDAYFNNKLKSQDQ